MTTVKKFKGIKIQRDEGGFFWEGGGSAGGGYFETVEECQDDIECHFLADEEAHPHLYQRDDTPSLGSPWWSDR